MAIGKNKNKNFGSNWDSISTSVVAELREQQLFDENRNFNAEQCRTLYKKLQDSWKLFNNALGPNRTGNMKNMSQEAVTKRPVNFKTHPKPASGAGRGGAAAAMGGAAPAALGGAPAAMGAAPAAMGGAAPAALGGAPAAMGAAPAAMGGAAPAALGGAPAAMGAAPAAWGGAAPAAWGVAPSGMGVAPAAWGAAPSSSGAAASSSGAAPAAQGLHQMYLQQLAILYQAVQRQQKQQEQVAAVEGEALQSQAFGPDTPKEATQRDAFFVPGTQYP
ncbi:hypothetical protein QJQ45_003184 [Haematococcus lacustris]|nr:hypothetical protein QJQ45_003184 [Haematococcus lacustris]